MTRPKTARAQEANVGIRNRFRKRLIQFSNQFTKRVVDDIFMHIANEGLLAQDESLSNPQTPENQRFLRQISSKVLAAWRRDPVAFRADIDNYVERHLHEWTHDADEAARKLAIWVARSIAADVTASQRRAYIAAGLSPEFFKTRWTIPVVRQHMSPKAAELLPYFVDYSTELITRMSTRDVYKLKELLITSFTEGRSVKQVRELLYSMKGFNEDRARNVAIDQTNKITQGILRANDEDLGIEEGIWVHVPGQYSSRHTHKAMNGKRFRLNEGLYDEDVGKSVVPAELSFCRCVYRPVIPFEKLGLKQNR